MPPPARSSASCISGPIRASKCAPTRAKPPLKPAFGHRPAVPATCSRWRTPSSFRPHSPLFVEDSVPPDRRPLFRTTQIYEQRLRTKARTLMYTQLGLYIDGKWNHGNGGGGEDVINPATQKALAHLPHATTSDLDAALAAAEKGFK